MTMRMSNEQFDGVAGNDSIDGTIRQEDGLEQERMRKTI
jgi:hypothetical protein